MQHTHASVRDPSELGSVLIRHVGGEDDRDGMHRANVLGGSGRVLRSDHRERAGRACAGARGRLIPTDQEYELAALHAETSMKVSRHVARVAAASQSSLRGSLSCSMRPEKPSTTPSMLSVMMRFVIGTFAMRGIVKSRSAASIGSSPWKNGVSMRVDH